MKIEIITPERGVAMACDECGFWPKKLLEIGLAKSPMVAKLCPSCASKLTADIQQCLPWTVGGGKRNAVG